MRNQQRHTTHSIQSLDDDLDDEKSDFLSEKQDLLRIPSKIAFKPMKGRSFALEVRQSDLGLLREGNVSDIQKLEVGEMEQRDEAEPETVFPSKKQTRKERRQRRKQMKLMKQQAKARAVPGVITRTASKKNMSTVVQANDGVEILATEPTVPSPSHTHSKKPSRWNLRRRFRAGKLRTQ